MCSRYTGDHIRHLHDPAQPQTSLRWLCKYLRFFESVRLVVFVTFPHLFIRRQVSTGNQSVFTFSFPSRAPPLAFIIRRR